MRDLVPESWRRRQRGHAVRAAAVVCLASGSLAMPAAANASSAPRIYWTASAANAIGAANLDGTGVNTTFITGASSPGAIAVDGQHIYWINRGNHTIGRANLDGTGVNESFITPAHVGLVGGIAVNSKFIYWGEGTNETVGRANVDGTGVPNDSFITGGNQTEGVAVDGNRIYWNNAGNGSLGEATLDGTVIGQALGFPGAYHLALDGQHLYFANVNPGGALWRSSLDGTGGDLSFIADGNNPQGLVVDSQHLYWGDSTGTEIRFSNLDGTGVSASFINTGTTPNDVAVSVPIANVSSPPAFASTPQGTLGTPRTVTVSNTGHQVLTVSGLSFAGPNANDFLIGSNTCMGRIDPGSTCQLEVYFAPQAPGARAATLLVTSNDVANSPDGIPLSGTGGALPQGPAGTNGTNGTNGTRTARTDPRALRAHEARPGRSSWSYARRSSTSTRSARRGSSRDRSSSRPPAPTSPPRSRAPERHTPRASRFRRARGGGRSCSPIGHGGLWPAATR